MLNDLNKNIKKIIKLLPENILNLTSKSAVYFGLAVYWCIIIAGTVFNII
tara:strand:+ start:479 stop:628 length:150 start_codon:yes stop_codon:yes gene_type:complete